MVKDDFVDGQKGASNRPFLTDWKIASDLDAIVAAHSPKTAIKTKQINEMLRMNLNPISYLGLVDKSPDLLDVSSRVFGICFHSCRWIDKPQNGRVFLISVDDLSCLTLRNGHSKKQIDIKLELRHVIK